VIAAFVDARNKGDGLRRLYRAAIRRSTGESSAFSPIRPSAIAIKSGSLLNFVMPH
jgi:hypothetical protein